jgi:Dodecin
MGGRGSGGHNSKRKLRDVQCARLDVHELARDGNLKPGKRGTLFGTIGFEVTGGPDAQQLVLEFPLRSVSGERLEPVRQTICCYWRPAHYGGRYLMFLDLRLAEVVKMDMKVENGKVTAFRTRVALSFKYEA